MAVAMIPPHMAAAMDKAKAERKGMNSPNPVERWKAKERAFNRGMAQMSADLVANARKSAKSVQEIEEKETYKITY